jgi:succinate dehydrogenase / fumarate reductase cytochrome b subunit
MAAPTATVVTKQAPAGGPEARKPRRRRPWLLDLYGSAVGKKYVMAITGIVWMGYVFAHMVGNLKVYLSEADLNHYAEWLRMLATPLVPRTVGLWLLRSMLIVALPLHIHAAYSLTVMNRRARRPQEYASRQDYIAANYASRTMRWSGVIVGLFILFHLMDLTWGNANPHFVRGQVYDNLVASLQRVPVAAVYIVANLALGLHLYHGAWSLFQSMGWNHPRFNRWRRWFAGAFAAVVMIGNVSIPVAVLTGVIS